MARRYGVRFLFSVIGGTHIQPSAQVGAFADATAENQFGIVWYDKDNIL